MNDKPYKRKRFAMRILFAVMVMILAHTFVFWAAALLMLRYTPIEIIILFVFGMVSAVVFAALMLRWINKIFSLALRRIAHVDKAVLEGEAKFVIRKGVGEEEINKVYNQFGELANNYIMLRTDLKTFTDELYSGNKRARIDESKYEGRTLEVVQRLNSLV